MSTFQILRGRLRKIPKSSSLGMPSNLNAHAKRKNECSIISSQELASNLVSLEMVFEYLQSELFRFKFD